MKSKGVAAEKIGTGPKRPGGALVGFVTALTLVSLLGMTGVLVGNVDVIANGVLGQSTQNTVLLTLLFFLVGLIMMAPLAALFLQSLSFIRGKSQLDVAAYKRLRNLSIASIVLVLVGIALMVVASVFLGGIVSGLGRLFLSFFLIPTIIAAGVSVLLFALLVIFKGQFQAASGMSFCPSGGR